MTIDQANLDDLNAVAQIDTELSLDLLGRKIRAGEIFVLRNEVKIVAYLRYSLFWDRIPFLNLLIVGAQERKKGYGSKVLQFWEEKMASSGHGILMTSSQADEDGQHFFRRRGYQETGKFDFPNQTHELILMKIIDASKPNQSPDSTPLARCVSA